MTAIPSILTKKTLHDIFGEQSSTGLLYRERHENNLIQSITSKNYPLDILKRFEAAGMVVRHERSVVSWEIV